MTLARLGIGPSGEVATGNITALNGTLGGAVDALNYQSVSVQVAGTWTATLSFQVSNDNTNWVSKTLVSSAAVQGASTTAVGIWSGDIGARYFRVIATAFTSGTVNTVVEFSGAPQVNPTATQAVSGTVTVNGTVTANPGTGATGPGKLEDAAAASGEMGTFILGVRRDAPTISASATGDYNELATGRHGELFTRHIDTSKRTYSLATSVNVAANVIFEMSASASSTVEITKFSAILYGTAAGKMDVQIYKRSTISTGGSQSNPAKVPHDAADAASGATARSFIAAPTAGTVVGMIKSSKLSIAASQTSARYAFEAGVSGKPIILAAASTQAITVELTGTVPTGAEMTLELEWNEY